MKRKYSICLGISGVYTILYMILLAVGLLNTQNTLVSDNPWEALGFQLGGSLFTIHLCVVFLASVFLVVAFIKRGFGFAITAGVLYSVCWIIMPITIIFMIPSIIFTFIGAVFCKKYKEAKQNAHDENDHKQRHQKEQIHQPSYIQQDPRMNQGRAMSFQNRQMNQNYQQNPTMQNTMSFRNPMMQAQDPYAPYTQGDAMNAYTGADAMYAQNQGMGQRVQMGYPVDQTMSQMQQPFLNPQMPQTNMAMMQPVQTGMDPFTQSPAYQDPMLQDPYAMNSAHMEYMRNTASMMPNSPVQGSPAPTAVPSVNEGYFDDYGNFHTK